MSTRFRRPISRYFIILATRRGIKAANVLIKTKTVKLSDCTIWHETYMETAIRRESGKKYCVRRRPAVFFLSFQEMVEIPGEGEKTLEESNLDFYHPRAFISLSAVCECSCRHQTARFFVLSEAPTPRHDAIRSIKFFPFFFVLFWSVSLLGWPSHERVGKAYISRVGSVSQLSFNLNARAQKYPAKTRAALQERRRVWSARVDGQRSSSRQQLKLLSSAK